MAKAYIVVFECPGGAVRTRAREFRIGEGLYAYVGSCGSSCWGRVGRHMERRGAKFWHVDYLPCRPVAAAVEAVEERQLARLLASSLEYVPGFGSSDDPAAPSHLFKLRSLSDLVDVIAAIPH